jgi:hypothetical protein
MTFEHLDDPNPPRPSELVVERIAAEAGRRIRHRRVLSGGVAVLLAVGVIGVAGNLRGSGNGNDDNVVIMPATTTAPPLPGETTTTTSMIVEPAANDLFAALIQAPNNESAQVVLAHGDTGETARVLAEFPLFNAGDTQWTCCIAIAPDRQSVFYVRPAGDYGAGQMLDTIWQVPVTGGDSQLITEGWEPALTPDGDTLGFIRPQTSDFDELVLRDLATGSERTFETPVGQSLTSLAFPSNGAIAFTLQSSGSPDAAYLLALDDSDVQLTDAQRLGPPDDAAEGTGWYALDRYGQGMVTVVESCCARTGSETSYASYSIATGEVDDVVATLPTLVIDAVTSPYGNSHLFLAPPADGAGPTSLLRSDGTDTLTPVPLKATTIMAVDW